MVKKQKSIGLRYCFNCRKPLDYHWYRKNPNFPAKVRLRIWNDKRIQLFCCYCYKAITLNKLEIKNRKLKPFSKFNSKYKLTKLDPKPIRDIIRDIDPINYKTLERFIDE